MLKYRNVRDDYRPDCRVLSVEIYVGLGGENRIDTGTVAQVAV